MAVLKPKPAKLSGSQQVEQFLERLEHPLKEEIRAVRKILLKADPPLAEHIKWNAPSYVYNGEDRVTFNLHGKASFRLVFHRGAKVKASPPEGRLFDDTTGLLEWVAHDRAIVTFATMQEVAEKEAALLAVVGQWLAETG